MKKLFKFLFWFVAIIILLIVGIYFTAGWWLPKIVSYVVPQMTKTPVTLGAADVSLLSGKIALKGFRIGNPSGFSSPDAFELGEISVHFQPKTIFQPKMIINEIKINGTKVAAEINKVGKMNLMQLTENVQEYFGNPKPSKTDLKPKTPTSVKSKKSEGSKMVIVKDLQINGSSLKFDLMGYNMQVKLPNIQQKNIGEKNSKTIAQVVSDIFETLTTTSLNQISKSGQDAVNSVLDGLSNRNIGDSSTIQGLKDQFKKLF